MKLLELESSSLEEMFDITEQVNEYVESSGVENGILVVQTINNTCSIISLSSQYGDVEKNLFATTTKLYPLMDGMQFMGHEIKCVRSGILGTSKSFIISGGKPVLGAFEHIYLVDFDGPTEKLVVVLLAMGSDVEVSEEENPAKAVEEFRAEYIRAKEEEKRREEEIVREMREEWQREHADDPRFKPKEEVEIEEETE